jgi:hypothetical protein
MRSICIALILALLIAPERTRLRPGFNLFSAQQDVEIGKEVSRDAEKKLRVIDDPRAMAQFFEKIEAGGGSRGSQFFSDHPNPGNRISSVNQEIAKLGGARPTKNDSADFQRIKRILKSK